jgi:hypothetical protein
MLRRLLTMIIRTARQLCFILFIAALLPIEVWALGFNERPDSCTPTQNGPTVQGTNGTTLTIRHTEQGEHLTITVGATNLSIISNIDGTYGTVTCPIAAFTSLTLIDDTLPVSDTTTVTINGGNSLSLSGGLTSTNVNTLNLTGATTVTAGGTVSVTGASRINIESSLTGGSIAFTADQGGTAVNNLDAIRINGNLTTTGNGNISMTGTLPATVTSTGASRGIVIESTATVRPAGTGTLTLVGTNNSTDTAGNRIGVLVAGTAATLGGNISITGTGGPGGFTYGVGVSGSVLAGGSGNVNVTGTGGASLQNGNYGVDVFDVNGVISSNGGNVSVTGTPGGAAIGISNVGVRVLGTISSGGTGTVTVLGNTANTSSRGVLVGPTTGIITSGGTGSVTVTGTGGSGTASDNYGVHVETGRTITSGGGNVAVTGTGGGSGVSTANRGVRVNGTITSGSTGTVTVLGNGGAVGTFAQGVFVANTGAITSGGAGTVSVTGNGGTGGGANSQGVNVAAGGVVGGRISSGGGNVTVTGTGGGSGTTGDCEGVVINASMPTGQINAGGTGSVSITGTGGAGTSSSNEGVNLGGGATLSVNVLTSNGPLTITAIGGSAGTSADLNLRARAYTANTLFTINADSLSTSGGGVDAGTSTLVFVPRTAGTRIDIGGTNVLTGSPKVLGINSASFDRLRGGTIAIGNASTGNITLSTSVTSGTVNTTFQLTTAPTAGIIPSATGVDLDLGSNGTLTFGTGTRLTATINGATVDTGYAQLSVTGGVNANNLVIAPSGTHVPANGASFELIKASGTRTGTPVTTSFTLNGVALNVSTTTTSVLATNPIPAITSTTTSITGITPAMPVAPASVTVAVSVTGGSPTGNVSVQVGGLYACTIALSGGVGNCTVTGVTGGTFAITASYGGDATHSSSSATGSVNVAKANQTITFGPLPNRNVGDAAFFVTSTASSMLTVRLTSTTPTVCEFDPGEFTPGGTRYNNRLNLLAAGTCTVAANQVGDSNFNAAAQVLQSFTIAKLSQTITLSGLSNRTIGAVPFTVSASASSMLVVTLTSQTTSVCTVAGNTVTVVAVGTCTLAANQAGSATYEPAAQVVQSFTVDKQGQTITFGSLSNRTLGSAPFTVSASASSMLAVTLNSQTSSVCTVTGNTVTLVAAGTCTIRASQLGNATFAAAIAVDQSFTVSSVMPPPPPCESIPTNDCDGDGVPNSVEVTQGTNPLVRDNNVFADTPLGIRLYLSQFYRDVLGREADEAGLQYWICRMNKSFSSACPAETTVVTRADMVVAFLFSPEALQGRTLTGEEAVNRLYVAMLRRNPEPEGLAFWSARYNGPNSLLPLAQSFLDAPEYRARFVP